MAGAHRPGERVVVVSGPSPPPRGGADDQRRVGDAAGDDDVGAVLEGAGDAEPAEVGVGGQRPVGPGRQRLAAGEMPQRVTGWRQRIEAVEDIVAVDVGDAQLVAAAGGQLAGCGGEAGRVESAGVDDEPDPIGHEGLEGGVEVVEEAGGVALGGVFGARLAEDEHRDLGEVVAGEDVDAAGRRHVGHGRRSVAVEPGAVPDADGTASLVGRRAHVVAPATDSSRASSKMSALVADTVPSKPTSPEGFILDELEGHTVVVGGGDTGGVGQHDRRVERSAQAVRDAGDAPSRPEPLGDGA